jgi:type VI secretion system secreted protein VgrG
VYQTSSDGALSLTGTLTLTGAGVYIFQTGSSLVTATGSSVVLAGGASPCDVFWQVGSSATLDGSTFVGTVMASTSITLGSGVTVHGRVLAGTGDVTLIGDTIDASACIDTASLPTPTTATTSSTPSTGAGGTSPLIRGRNPGDPRRPGAARSGRDDGHHSTPVPIHLTEV